MLKGPSSPAATGTQVGPKQPPPAAIAAAKARSAGVAIPPPKPSPAAPTDDASRPPTTTSTPSSVHPQGLSTTATPPAETSIQKRIETTTNSILRVRAPIPTTSTSTSASSTNSQTQPQQAQAQQVTTALPTLFTVAFAGLPAVSLPPDAQKLSTIALPNWGMVWRRDHAHLVVEQNFLFEHGLLGNSSGGGGGSNTPATNSSPPSSATFLLQQQQQQQQQKSSNLKSLLMGVGGGGLSAAAAVTSFGSSFEGTLAVAPREGGGGKAAVGTTPSVVGSVGFGAFGTFFTTTYSLTNVTLWASKSRSTGVLVGDTRREGGGGGEGATSRRARSPTIASIRSSSPSSSSPTKRNRGMTSFSFSFSSSNSPLAADGSTDLAATGTPIPAVYLTLGGSVEDDAVAGETGMKNGAKQQAPSSSSPKQKTGGLGGTSSSGDYSIDGMAQLLPGQSNGNNSSSGGGLIAGSVDGAVEGLMEAGAAVGALIGKSNRVVTNVIQSAANFLLVKKDENDIVSSPQGDAVDAGGAAGRTPSATSGGGSTAPPYSSFSSATGGVATHHISSSVTQSLATAIETTANKPLTIRLDDFLIQSVPKMVVAPSFEAMAEMEERLTYALALSNSNESTTATTATITSSTAAVRGGKAVVASSSSTSSENNDSFGSLLGSGTAQSKGKEGEGDSGRGGLPLGNNDDDNTTQKRIVDLILATFYQTPTHGKDLFADYSSSSSSEASLSGDEADETIEGGASEKEGTQRGNSNNTITITDTNNNNNKMGVTSNGSSTRSSSTQSKSRSTPTTAKRPNLGSSNNMNNEDSSAVRPSDSLLSQKGNTSTQTGGGRREGGKGATTSSRGAMATAEGGHVSSSAAGGTQLLTTAKVTASKIPAGRGLRERNPTWYHGEYFLRLVPKNVAAMRSAAIAQRTHALLMMSRASGGSGVGGNSSSGGGGGESAPLLPLVNHIVNDQQQKRGGGLPPLLAHFLLSFALKGAGGGVKNHSSRKESREDENNNNGHRGGARSNIISSSFTDNAAFLDDIIEDGNNTTKKNTNNGSNSNSNYASAAADPLLLDSFDFYDPSTVIDLHFRSGRERDRWLNILLSLKSGPQTEDQTFPFGRGHLPPPPLPITGKGKAGGLSKKSKADESGEGASSPAVGGGANGAAVSVGEGSTTVSLEKDTDVFALSPSALASLPPPRVNPADGSVTVLGGAMFVVMDPSRQAQHHLTDRGLVGGEGSGWAGLGGRGGQALHAAGFGPNAALIGLKGHEHHQQGVSIGGLSSSRSTSGTATPAQTAQHSGGTPTTSTPTGERGRRALYPFSQQQGGGAATSCVSHMMGALTMATTPPYLNNLGLPLAEQAVSSSSNSPSLALAGSDPLLFLAKLGRGVAGGDAREALPAYMHKSTTTLRRSSSDNNTRVARQLGNFLPRPHTQRRSGERGDEETLQREETFVSAAFVVVHREVVFSTAQDGGFVKKAGAEQIEMSAAAADGQATSAPSGLTSVVSKNLSLSRGLFPPHFQTSLPNASSYLTAYAHRLYYTPNGTPNLDRKGSENKKEEDGGVRSKGDVGKIVSSGTTANDERKQNYFLYPEDHACSIAFTTRRWNPLRARPEWGVDREKSATDCCSIWWMELTARGETKAMGRRNRRAAANYRNKEEEEEARQKRRDMQKVTSSAASSSVIDGNTDKSDGAEVVRGGQYNTTTMSRRVWDATPTPPRRVENLILDEDLAIQIDDSKLTNNNNNKRVALQSRESLLREFEALFASSDEEKEEDVAYDKKVESSERHSGDLQDMRRMGVASGGGGRRASENKTDDFGVTDKTSEGKKRRHFNNNDPGENSDFEGLLPSLSDPNELRSGSHREFDEGSDSTDGGASDSTEGCGSADSYQSISVPIHAVDCLVSYERIFCTVDEEDDNAKGTQQPLGQSKEDAYLLIADFTTYEAASSKFTTPTTNSVKMGKGEGLVLFSASDLTADKAIEKDRVGEWDIAKKGEEMAFTSKSNDFSAVPRLHHQANNKSKDAAYPSASHHPPPPSPHSPLSAALCAILSVPPECIKSGISSTNSDLLEQLRIDALTKRAEAEAIMQCTVRRSSFSFSSHSLSSDGAHTTRKKASSSKCTAAVESSSPRKTVKTHYYYDDRSNVGVAREDLVAPTFDAIIGGYMLEKTRLRESSSRPSLPAPTRPFSSSSPSSFLRENRKNGNGSEGSRGGVGAKKSSMDLGAVTVYYLDLWYWWLASSDHSQNRNEEKEQEQGKQSASETPPPDSRRCFLEPRKVTLAFATSADRDAFVRALARRWKEAVVASLIIASSASSSLSVSISCLSSPMPSKETFLAGRRPPPITAETCTNDLAVLHTILRRIFHQCTSPEELLASMTKADELYSDRFASSSLSSLSRATNTFLYSNEDYLRRLCLLWSATFNTVNCSSSAKSDLGNFTTTRSIATELDSAGLSQSASDLHRISLLDRAPPFCFDTAQNADD